ncbi:MAG: hypothetical protein HQK59_10600 [Deltaproteobacteria bacterium]|nr:hypothetical protein [Deltaproteobacteria bacterium]
MLDDASKQTSVDESKQLVVREEVVYQVVDQATEEQGPNPVDEMVREEREKFREEGGLLDFIYKLRGKRIVRKHYVKKLKLACDAEMSNLKLQIDLKLRSSEKQSKADYDNIIHRTRVFREMFTSALTAEARKIFANAFAQATEDYENILMKCKPADHENELINAARRLQMENCTKIFETSITSIMERMESYQAEWEKSAGGSDVMMLD